MKAGMRVALVLLAVMSLASSAVAGAPRHHPRRWTRGSYTEYQVFPRDGKIATRTTYTGYTQKFPMPYFLFDGPHSGNYGQVFDPRSGY